MAANLQPLFPLTPVIGLQDIATANTARDGTGTIADLLTAGSNGTIVNRVTMRARVTTTVGVIRLFIKISSTYYLFEEVLVTAITPSTTVAVWSGASTLITAALPLSLPSGYKLSCSTHVAENFVVVAHGGNY